MASAKVEVVYVLVDKLTGGVNAMTTRLGQLNNQIIRATTTMGGLRQMSQRLNAVLQGLGVGIGIGSFYAFERALGELLNVIPNLINKGNEWLGQLHDLQAATGMRV